MQWNFLSPVRTSTPYDQSTNFMSHNSYVNESINLEGKLYIKNEKNQISQLSEACTIYMAIINEKSFEYSLIIKNNNKSHWDTIQFVIDKDCQLFQFINRLGNKCIMLYKNATFYILELFNNSMTYEKENIFLEKLSTLKTSATSKISLNEATKLKDIKEESILNCGQINELSIVLDDFFKKEKIKMQSKIFETNSPRKYTFSSNNSNNNFINKNVFMRNFPIYKELYFCKGTPFKFDKYIEDVIPIEKYTGSNNLSLLKINKVGYNNYILVLEQNDNILAYTKIENNIDISINEKYASMSFISQQFTPQEESAAFTFAFEDKSLNEINYLKNIILRCLYEKNNYVEDFSNVPSVSKFGFTNTDLDLDNDIIYDEFSFLSSKSKIIDIGQFSLTKNINSKENTKNKLILQSCNNHTYVIKENNKIDIFKTNIDDNKLINISSISPIKKWDENSPQEIVISKAKMFNNDKEILFQDLNSKNTIYQYDLNKQQIIQDWDCDINKNIYNLNKNFSDFLIDFTYPKKLGQLNEKNEIIGINSNSVVLLDGRVNRKKKIVDLKCFTNNPDFKSVITTGFGGIATGSGNGDIRLFSEVGRNAKTLITGFDHPIRYIDTTIDGKYILATCDKYIMVIKTENEYNINGFNTCLGKTNIQPLILHLSHNDLIKYNIYNEMFTPAKFNNNTNCKEMMIISSLGQYVILWNFNQVQNGETNLYRVINVNEYVIGKTTKFDKNQIIIALPDKLRLQNEKLLVD